MSSRLDMGDGVGLWVWVPPVVVLCRFSVNHHARTVLTGAWLHKQNSCGVAY